MSMTSPKSQRRGYMLVEAVIAGAVVAVALTSLVAQFGAADRQGSAAVRLTQATQALADGLGRAHSCAWASVTGGTDYPPGTVDRVITVTSLTTSECQGCKKVVVTVRYKNAIGVTQTLTETTYRAN